MKTAASVDLRLEYKPLMVLWQLLKLRYLKEIKGPTVKMTPNYQIGEYNVQDLTLSYENYKFLDFLEGYKKLQQIENNR